MNEIQDRLAEVYALHDAMVARINDECQLSDSLLAQVMNDPEVMDKTKLLSESLQALESAQSDAKDVDVDNPGKEGYVLIFDLMTAWNANFRATRDLLQAESTIYEAHGCDMPPLPEWLADL